VKNKGPVGTLVLRRIFCPRRDEVIGEWRKLHNKEINDLDSSTNIFRVTEAGTSKLRGDPGLDNTRKPLGCGASEV